MLDLVFFKEIVGRNFFRFSAVDGLKSHELPACLSVRVCGQMKPLVTV